MTELCVGNSNHFNIMGETICIFDTVASLQIMKICLRLLRRSAAKLNGAKMLLPIIFNDDLMVWQIKIKPQQRLIAAIWEAMLNLVGDVVII